MFVHKSRHARIVGGFVKGRLVPNKAFHRQGDPSNFFPSTGRVAFVAAEFLCLPVFGLPLFLDLVPRYWRLSQRQRKWTI